jgi:hypothetical protein
MPTFEEDASHRIFRFTWRREINVPQVYGCIQECHSIYVACGLSSDLPNHTGIRLFAGFGGTDDNHLLRAKLPLQDDRCSMMAQHDGSPLLNEALAPYVRPKNPDGSFIGNSIAAPPGLQFHILALSTSQVSQFLAGQSEPPFSFFRDYLQVPVSLLGEKKVKLEFPF